MKDEDAPFVLKDESITSCPACGAPIVVNAEDGCFKINGEFVAECEDEIFPMPCCNAEATFNPTGVWEG